MRYPGIQNDYAIDKDEGLELIGTSDPDLVIIDSPFKGTNIEKLILEIRGFSNVPVIVLAEFSAVMDKVKFLEAGADECISKPINHIECLATINALIRRCVGFGFGASDLVRLNERVSINPSTHEVDSYGERLSLTPIEYNLISILAENRGHVLSHKILLERIWGSDYAHDVTLLKRHIFNLRSKIEENPHMPRLVLSERGYGYKLAVV